MQYIQNMMNIIKHCEDEHIDGMLMSLDFEKAFDSVEWDFEYDSLEYFGFPLEYINLIETLYEQHNK